MLLTEKEREELKEQLKGFVKRCTADVAGVRSPDRPSPEEIAILPEIVHTLLHTS